MFRAGAMTSMQVAAGLLLVFAGWGFRDLPAFFGQPARAWFVVLAVLSVGIAVAWRVETQPIRKGLLPTGRQGLQLGVLLALSLLLLWFLPFADRRGLLTFPFSRLRYAGLGLCAVGGVVRLSAMRRLGRQFSAYVTLQPEHLLVQSGIYGSIRHPLYLSLLLVPAGIAMVFASWLALPIFLLSGIFVADRIAKEEQLLARGFGPEFVAYRGRTRKLIPYLF
jgi:protein-S-isoprenylcysteine O-methyltransferase Ste14